jgi:hypothetical protein
MSTDFQNINLILIINIKLYKRNFKSGIRKLTILKRSSLKFINMDKKSAKFEEIKGKTGIDRRIRSKNSLKKKN